MEQLHKPQSKMPPHWLTFPILCVFFLLPAPIFSYGITKYHDLNCPSLNYTLPYSDCSNAFQNSIPIFDPATTQGGLHKGYGRCYVTTGKDRQAQIVKGLLSHTGQAAMKDSQCYDSKTDSLRPGSVLVPNFMGLANFKVTWMAT